MCAKFVLRAAGLTSCLINLAAAQSITGITPFTGQVGDVVTINGSGFPTSLGQIVVKFGPNRAPLLTATATQLTVRVPHGQPLGPTSVTVNDSSGRAFITTTRSKIALPPNPAAACQGCACACSCPEPNSSPCVTRGAYLGGSPGNGDIYGERGEFFQTVTDLSIPGRPGAAPVVQFTVQRQYRSAAVNNGAMASKWDHNYFENLQVEADGSVVHHNGLGRNDLYLVNNLGSFVAPPEFYTQLTHNPPPDNTYILQYRDHATKEFDSTGKLLKITDRNGNSLTFIYNPQGQLVKIRDTLDTPAHLRDINYSYDGNGRLTQIIDFIGRKITYAYDSSGNLVSVTTPAVTGTPNGNDFPAGKTTAYTYDANHRLLTITRPNETSSSGPPVLQNSYDSNGRVISQIYGGTNASGSLAGGTYTYTYTPLNQGVNSDDPNLAVMTTQQVDRNGNKTQYDFNRLGYPVARREYTRGLRPIDPQVYVTTMRYNADGRLAQTTLPAGNSIQYTYDEGNWDRFQQGNMLQETRLPDAARGGDQAFLTTTYTYEAVFNHITTMTEPRGNDPSYVPQNGGAQSAARYTTTYTYDSSGDLVQRVQPTVMLLNGTPQPIITDYTYNPFGQMTSETDPEGNVTLYQYCPTATPSCSSPDSSGGGYLQRKITDATTSPRRTEPSPPTMITTQYFYDVVGNTIRIIDGRGNDMLYTYNQLNEVVEMQAELPFRYITYTFYDANDNVVQRNVENKVVIETDGKPTFTPDANFKVQDGTPNFFINRYAYDILDHVVNQDLDATGSTPPRVVTQFQYDPDENRTRDTLPVGNMIAYQYDERNLPFTKTRGAGNSGASTATYDYDQNRNLTETVDGRSLVTLYDYDGFDRRTKITDAVGGQMISFYDPANNVVSTSSFGQPGGPSPTDSSGAGNVLLNQRNYKYDELSRRFQSDEAPVNGTSFVASGVTTKRPPSIVPGPLNPPNISTQFSYDRNSRLVQRIEDDLATMTTQYDGVNRPVLVTDPVGNATASTYDANNNLVRKVETDLSQKNGVASETFTTTYQYDSHNRQTIVSDNCQNTRRRAYDSRDNLTDMTDAKVDNTVGCPGTPNSQGNSMRYVYDGLSRRLETIQDLRVGGVGSGPIDTTNPFNSSGHIVTTTIYDASSRVIALTDNNGNTTQHAYDALDRRISETLPDGTPPTIYTYDPDDNVITLKDNNRSLQTHSYDGLNRRTQTKVTPSATFMVIGTTLNTYQYDGLSRMTLMTDNNDPADPTSVSTVTTAYDSLSRVVEEVQNGHAIDSSWTAQARRTDLIYPNGRELDYTYDALERIQTIKDANATTNSAQYTYIGPERVLQRQYQNGTRLTYLDNAGTTDIGYDPLRRTIERRDLTAANSLIVGFTHTYDPEDNKANESKVLPTPTINSEAYAYDSVYRITNFQRAGRVGPKTEQWTLDGVGNWRVDTINGIPQSRSVNSVNEYTQIVSPSLPPDDLSYDNNGNLTLSTGQALAYEWDYRNRLRRVCKLIGTALDCSSPGASVTAVYTYDAMNRRTRKVVTNSGPVNGATSFYYDGWRNVEERDSADTLTQQYIHGIYLDEPLALDHIGGTQLFYHQNTLYSTFALTDTTGNVVEGYQYDAYGQQTVLGPDFTTVLGTISTVGNPYIYTGQRFDPETGLYYYRARYYDPAKGRFLQRDPLEFIDGMNLYRYALDNPPNNVDPTGLQARVSRSRTFPGNNGGTVDGNLLESVGSRPTTRTEPSGLRCVAVTQVQEELPLPTGPGSLPPNLYPPEPNTLPGDGPEQLPLPPIGPYRIQAQPILCTCSVKNARLGGARYFDDECRVFSKTFPLGGGQRRQCSDLNGEAVICFYKTLIGVCARDRTGDCVLTGCT
jgi:RHS repeat-associated protein